MSDRVGTELLHEDGYDLVAEIEAGLLKGALVPLDAISDEYLVKLGSDGLHVNGTDPADVAMVDVEIPASAFESIEGEAVEFGMYVPNILEYAERVEGTVQVGYNDAENDLELQSGRHRYEVGTIDAGSVRDHSNIPELDLTTEIRISTAEFRECVEYCGWCADYLRFKYDPEDGLFGATSETSTENVVYELTDEDIQVDEGGRANSMFSVDYSKDMVEGLPESETVLLRLAEEHPMRITYELSEQDGGEQATVELLQAPRIKSE